MSGRRPERKRLRGSARVGYVFAVPVALLFSLYLALYLSLNSLQGAQLAMTWVNQVLPGTVTTSYLEVDWRLNRVALGDVSLADLEGRSVVTAGELSCSIELRAVLNREVVLNDCHAADGRVIIKQDAHGRVGLGEALLGRYGLPRMGAQTPTIVVNSVTLEDFGLLLDFTSLALRFEGISLGPSDMRMDASGRQIELGELRYTEGRVVLSERVFSLGSGKPDWAHADWEIQRASSPWEAYDAIPTHDGRGGVLDLPLTAGGFAGARHVRDGFEFRQLSLPAAGASIVADGYLGFFPEVPRLGPGESGGFAYEGQMNIEMAPDHPLISFIVPDMIAAAAPEEEGQIAPFTLSAYGNLGFSNAGASLDLRDLLVRGWYVERLGATIDLTDGVMRILPGAYADIWDGHVDLAGEFVVADGTFHADVCLDGIQLNRIVPMGEPGSMLDQWLSARLSTTPARCADTTQRAGAVAVGDLTRKGLWINPALSTLPGRPVGPDPLALRADHLVVDWETRPGGLPLRRLRLDVDARVDQRGTWHLGTSERPGLAIDGAGLGLTFAGSWVPSTNALGPSDVSLRVADLARWLTPFGVTAVPSGVTVATTLSLQGPFSALELGGGTLEASHPVFADGIPDFDFSTRYTFDGDAIRLDGARLSSRVGEIRADGRVVLFDGGLSPRSRPRLDLDVEVEDLSLGRLLPGRGIVGLVNTSAHVGGTPDALELEGNVLASDLFVVGEPIDIVQTGYVLSDDRIELTDLWVIAGKGRLNGDVVYDLTTRVVNTTLQAREFDLDEVRFLVDRGLALRGELNADIVARGQVGPGLDLSGRLSIDGFTAYGWSFGYLHLVWDTFDEVVEVVGTVATDVALDVQIPLDRGPVTLQAAVQDIEIADHWRPFASVADHSSVTAHVDGVFDAFGETPRYEVALDVDRVELAIGDQVFDTPSAAAVRWVAIPGDEGMQQEVVVDGFAIGTEDHYLVTNGTLSNFSALALTIDGALDAGLLRFFPFLVVDAEGLARVDIGIEGSVSDPSISGQIDLTQVRVAPRALGTSLYVDTGRLVLTPDAIVMPQRSPLRGSIFGGDFAAWGEIPLQGLLPAALALDFEFDNITYSVPQEMNIVLHGNNMHLAAANLRDPTSWSIAGDIEIADGRYYNTVEFMDLSLGGRTAQRFELPIWQRVELIHHMEADLTIVGRDNFFFEPTIGSAELDVELQTDLRLTGTFGAMNLQGEALALSGSTVVFRGRTMDVEEGRVEFDGYIDDEGFPWPLLDATLSTDIRPCGIQATSTIATTSQDTGDDLVHIVVEADGRAPLNFDFELESTPFHDQRDILALILTGCTVDALASSTGGATIDIVLSPLFDIVEGELEEYLDVDDVDINPTAEGNATIRVQDELSDRVTYTLNATIGTDSENQQNLTGEFRIFDWLSFELTEASGENQNVGADSGLRVHFALD